MSEVISPSSKVSLKFALSTTDGREIDSTFDRDAVSFVMGDGSLLPGFEKHLVGLTPGFEGTFSVPPEDAFGQPNELNFQRVARDLFAPDQAIEVGLVMNFANGPEGEIAGVIHEITDSEVVVNFNHPLAGEILNFKVLIVAVESAE